jgi:hypothetical protein
MGRVSVGVVEGKKKRERERVEILMAVRWPKM